LLAWENIKVGGCSVWMFRAAAALFAFSAQGPIEHHTLATTSYMFDVKDGTGVACSPESMPI